MNIYRADMKDVDKVAKLSKLLWPHHSLEELIEEFTCYMSEEKNVVFLALVDDCEIGFAQCGLRHDYVEGTSSSPVGYLEGIFVSEDYRKKGVAKELVSACQKWAKEKGCREFASDCEFTNEDSYKFHLKVGFTEANRIICFTKEL